MIVYQEHLLLTLSYCLLLTAVYLLLALAKRLKAEIERLQAALDDANDTLQLHQASGDYEAGRWLAEQAASAIIDRQRLKIDRLRTALSETAEMIELTEDRTIHNHCTQATEADH